MAAARWRRDGGVADPESLLGISGLDCRDSLSLVGGGASSASLISSFSTLTRSATPSSSSSSEGGSNWTRVWSGTKRAVHDLGK